MKTPHVHAEMIKQWADEPSKVVQHLKNGEWCDLEAPAWTPGAQYRFRPVPETKHIIKEYWFAERWKVRSMEHWEKPNLCLTYLGDELTKAEVL